MYLRTICLAALLGASCGGPRQPAPPPATPKKVVEKPAPVLPAPQAEIRGELLGSLVLGGLDSIVGAASAYLAPALPAALQPMVQPDALKAELLKKLHLEGLGAAVDSSRPIALAFADPEAYRHGVVGAAVVAVPLKDTSAFVDALGRIATRQETTAWKDRRFELGGKALLCRVEKDWGFLASHEKLLHGARSALLPLVEKSVPGRVQLSIDMAALHARYGARLDRAADGIAAGFNKPEMASLKATITRWIAYLKGTRALDLRLDLQPGKLQALLAAQAAGQGELRKYVDTMAVGDPWGAKYIPADSVLLYVNRTRPDARPQMIDDAFQLLKAKGGALVDEAALTRLRDAILASSAQFGGESAGGVWVSADGGIGMGGAVAVKDAAAAQKQLASLMKVAGKILSQLLQKKAAAAGKIKLALGVRPGALAVGGLKADLFELAITWPRPKEQAERDRMATIKKGVTKLFGAKPTFAFVATGEVGLMVFGKDYKKRLGELVAIAKGGPGTTSEKVLRELAAGRSPALLVHAPLASVVEGAMRVADQLTTVPADVRDAINKVLPGPGRNIPVTALMHKAGDTLFWELSVSPDLIAAVAKAFVWMRGVAAAP